MSRKTASDKTNLTPITANEEKTGQEPENGQEVNAQDNLNVIESEFGDVLLSGKGKKLSPKSDSFVYFELAIKNSDNQLHIRLTGNDSGGCTVKSTCQYSRFWMYWKSWTISRSKALFLAVSFAA
ncbi:hypothetical protein [Vibrio toranzoniae]|uniref:hypothetical protein n=1 Tax=Vibrio toranzoniae TaxID=1194427 RepID=UPI001F2C4EE5|nr:hypothetical protein [Vibrio toranzoniae]